VKTIDRIDKFLVGCELKSPMWHVLHILRMNAVQDEIAIQDAMEEIAEMSDEYDDCLYPDGGRKCDSCKFIKNIYPMCKCLYAVHKHTGLEPMPHE